MRRVSFGRLCTLPKRELTYLLYKLTSLPSDRLLPNGRLSVRSSMPGPGRPRLPSLLLRPRFLRTLASVNGDLFDLATPWTGAVVGGFALAGSAMVIFSLNLLFGVTVPIGPGPVWQGAFGVVAGVLGGLSSIWSPPVAMYLIARDTPKERFIGAAGFLFLAGCVPLGIGLVMSGLITWVVIIKSSLGLATTLIGFRVGEILRERVSQNRFRQIVLVAFLLMGMRLIAVGLL